jgi:maleylacetate reductase
MRFAHQTLPQRVLFGAGCAAGHLRDEIDRGGYRRVLVIAGAHDEAAADRLAEELPVVQRWSEVRQHVPVGLAEQARGAARECDVDVLVAIGGGSTTGLAKAVALTTRLPIIAVPTTYAGSEATNVWGLTEGGAKTTGVDDRVLPVAVVYDSELTLGLPVPLSVASGLNALAHCVDSLWAPRADPISTALALEGAHALAVGLPAVARNPDGIDARDRCLYGAYLAAVAFASAGSGLHHKIAHVLGGAYDLPHAETHAVVLPHVLALNGSGLPDQGVRLDRALRPERAGGPDDGASALVALEDLRRRLDAPHSLRALGMRESDIPDAVRRVSRVVPESNPVPVDEPALTSLVRAAWAGTSPVSATTG